MNRTKRFDTEPAKSSTKVGQHPLQTAVRASGGCGRLCSDSRDGSKLQARACSGKSLPPLMTRERTWGGATHVRRWVYGWAR